MNINIRHLTVYYVLSLLAGSILSFKCADRSSVNVNEDETEAEVDYDETLMGILTSTGELESGVCDQEGQINRLEMTVNYYHVYNKDSWVRRGELTSENQAKWQEMYASLLLMENRKAIELTQVPISNMEAFYCIRYEKTGKSFVYILMNNGMLSLRQMLSDQEKFREYLINPAHMARFFQELLKILDVAANQMHLKIGKIGLDSIGVNVQENDGVLSYLPVFRDLLHSTDFGDKMVVIDEQNQILENEDVRAELPAIALVMYNIIVMLQKLVYPEVRTGEELADWFEDMCPSSELTDMVSVQELTSFNFEMLWNYFEEVENKRKGIEPDEEKFLEDMDFFNLLMIKVQGKNLWFTSGIVVDMDGERDANELMLEKYKDITDLVFELMKRDRPSAREAMVRMRLIEDQIQKIISQIDDSQCAFAKEVTKDRRIILL